MDMPTLSLRDIARAYLRAGWHPFELPAGSKGPPPIGRTGYDGVNMTDAEVEQALWAGGVGIRMPADVIGLDVDAYHGGLDTLKELIEQCEPLPKTWISHSGRNDDSGIRFYRVPVGMAWIAGLPGIEVIQLGHRYAAVWPSMHPEGRQYQLWDQTEAAPTTDVPLVEDLPYLPWSWINVLARATKDDWSAGARPHAASFAEVQEAINAWIGTDAVSYMSNIVERFKARRALNYSRHDSMQHCLIWAMENARAGIFPAASVIHALGEVWQDYMLPDTQRAELWSERRVTEFDAMLRFAVGKVNARSQADIDRIHDDIAGVKMNVPPKPTPDVSHNGSPIADAPRMTLFTFGHTPDPFVLPAVEWHAEALLARPTHGELAGAEKSLKSYTGLCIDVALAAGLPVFGRFAVPEPQRVSMLNGEGGQLPWLRRYEAVCKAYGITTTDIRDRVRFTMETASVTSPKFLDSVLAELEHFGPALVHLDPWYAYAGGQTDSRQVSEVGASLAVIGDMCARHGASLLINHHYNRQGAEGLRAITGAGHAEWVDSWLLVHHRVKAEPGAGRYRLRLAVGSRQWGGDEYDLDFDIEPIMGTVKWRITEATDEGDDGDADPLTEPKLAIMRAGRKARKAMTRAVWLGRTKGRATMLRAAFEELVIEGHITVVATVKSGSNSVSTYEVSEG